jgi:predicted dinucleotide-binding enzyme
MNEAKPVIGVLGAGQLGMVLARLAANAGYQVVIAGSRDPKRVALPPGLRTKGVTAMTATDAAAQADLVVLALPFGKFRTIPVEPLAGKLVIDAMNYWWEVDGFSAPVDPLGSSSELVQEHLAASRIVKAFNHMAFRDLEAEARPNQRAGRKAIGLAGDDAHDLARVARVIDDLGFETVVVGRLADGVKLEPGTEAFGADVDASELREMIARFPTSQRGLRRAALKARRGSGSDPIG